MSKITYEQMQAMRERQRERRKEEGLDSKNAWGISDPTPKKAVENIIFERRNNGNPSVC